jgi:redox-sensitive bicupin YhaK (pirin superfamily)
MKRRNFIHFSLKSLLLGLIIPAKLWANLIRKKEKNMKITLHKANTRGVADHGWLNSHHTFSFANYYNADRMGFGALRVINDDIVHAKMGFGTHPHRDMEIISIPLRGSLKHKDNMGNEHVIKKGEVQAMTAGTGVTHSEYNNSEVEDVNFLQIWVLPALKGIKPNYSQKEFTQSERLNKAQLVVSPDGREGSVQINQDAYFSLIDLEDAKSFSYSKYNSKNGVYFFVLEGSINLDETKLDKRDGLAIEGEGKLNIKSNQISEVLIMEIPLMQS